MADKLDYKKVAEKAAQGAVLSFLAALSTVTITNGMDVKAVSISLGIAALGGAVTGIKNYLKHRG